MHALLVKTFMRMCVEAGLYRCCSVYNAGLRRSALTLKTALCESRRKHLFAREQKHPREDASGRGRGPKAS